jgi:signal transduction histidine kinase
MNDAEGDAPLPGALGWGNLPMTTILVIEDTVSVLSTILDILRTEYDQVHGATNGRDGMRLVRQHLPDVVICDIMMPEIDGHAVLRAMRADPTTATIPVIFLTARAERTDMRLGMELGADDYIPKPFEPLELLRAVQAQLDKRAAIVEKYETSLRTLRRNIAYALPHELKTPLVGIEGYARLLAMDYDRISPEKILEYATWMVKSSERLQRLIENCLIYAQIEIIAADPEQLEGLRNHCTANPADIIADVARKQAKEAGREQDLRLEFQNAPLQISEEDLKKIVAEVVNNAFKFSDRRSEVAIVSSVKDGVFSVRVTDCGRGLTPVQIASIGAYMQFERALYEQQGIGLGLIIARRLVELHNGQIEVKSIPGTTTSVTIHFPVISS